MVSRASRFTQRDLIERANASAQINADLYSPGRDQPHRPSYRQRLEGHRRVLVPSLSFLPILILVSGLAICHNFNTSPEDLRWKLEAINFSASATHSEIKLVTLDSILTLKTQMQRDLTQKKAQPKSSTVAANVSRLRNKIPMPAMSATASASAAGKSVVARVKQEDIQVAGPSRVVFSGPKQSGRACES